MSAIEISGRNSEGEDVTVTIDDESLPDGLLSAATVRDDYVLKSVYERHGVEIEKRIGRAKSVAVEEWRSSIPSMEEDALTEFMADLKGAVGADRLRESLGFKPVKGEAELEAERERIVAQVRKQEVEPMDAVLAGKDKRITKLLEAQFRAEFREAAADVGVIAGLRQVLEDSYLRRVVYSEEHDRYFMRGPDGEPLFSAKAAEANAKDGTHGPNFRSIFEDLDDSKTNGTMAEAFSAEVRDGVDYGGVRTVIPTKVKKSGDMNAEEKSAFISEHGLDAWEAHVIASR